MRRLLLTAMRMVRRVQWLAQDSTCRRVVMEWRRNLWVATIIELHGALQVRLHPMQCRVNDGHPPC